MFIERHPNLHIQLQLGDKRQDLVRDAVDVAIRLGRLADSTATAKRIGLSWLLRTYLARYGVPEMPMTLPGTGSSVARLLLYRRPGGSNAMARSRQSGWRPISQLMRMKAVIRHAKFASRLTNEIVIDPFEIVAIEHVK